MHDLYKDLRRLDDLSNDDIGLEYHSISVKMFDFLDYFKTRFVYNFKAVFKDFSTSELLLFAQRYKRQLALTFDDRLLDLSKILVAIPQGMINPYLPTLTMFLDLSQTWRFDRLSDDVAYFTEAFHNGKKLILKDPVYTKKNFDTTVDRIGKAYRAKGLTYAQADKYLISLTDTKTTYEQLLVFCEQYYPQVIAICKQIDLLKTAVPKSLTADEKTHILSLGYRLSVFAAVMDNIQKMEHAFVKALLILKTQSHRHM